MTMFGSAAQRVRPALVNAIFEGTATRFLRRIHRLTHRMPFKLRQVQKQRVLVVAPHPDDEVIATGGTLGLHGLAGSTTQTAFVTMDPPLASGEFVRKREATAAGELLGYERRFLDYPDGCVSLHEAAVARDLAAIVREFRPDVVFCPFPGDHHRDHQATAASTSSALSDARWDGEVWCYEVWSSLWPNVGVDISTVTAAKRAAIDAYASQTQVTPYSEAALALNRYRGLKLGVPYAEAFFVSSPRALARLCQSLTVV
jgi:LmbE family N-acetylglucosaminyl deacetylase